MYGIRSGFKVKPPPPGKISLAGKTVIVVGGTGGIGRGLARASAAAGAKVFVVGRKLRGEDAGVTFVKGDVSTIAEARRITASLPIESCDVLAFTVGIVPSKIREVTADNVEVDMGVSALSRHVIIAESASRLPKTARVLVWGFPGSKGYYQKSTLDDFNSEKKYEAAFGSTHMNTVALNEALVHHWAAKGMTIAGFNPGLVATEIRNPIHGGGCFGGLLEGLIGCMNPSVDKYVSRILHLLVAPELETNKGLLFNQGGDPIKCDPAFEDPATVEKWIDAADKLVARVRLPRTLGRTLDRECSALMQRPDAAPNVRAHPCDMRTPPRGTSDARADVAHMSNTQNGFFMSHPLPVPPPLDPNPPGPGPHHLAHSLPGLSHHCPPEP